MSIDRDRPLTAAESAELKDLIAKKRAGGDQGTFTSTHWDEKNVLAHIRVNDRVDADGKKMLLIEEVQSDWHQAGRDKGYKGDPRPTAKAYQVSIEGRPVMAYETMEEAQAHVQRASQFNDPNSIRVSETMVEVNDPVAQAGRVPDAPMKDTWYQLALKRALKYAADNGYERVGLTTGARQAERYKLSSQVNQIVVTPRTNAATGEQTRSVAVDLKSAGILQLGVNKDGIVDTARGGFDNPGQFKGKPLSDVVGKEMANKIMGAERATFEGDGLNVGGEGMKKYYDEVYPKFLEKYGKKWDSKMGETALPIFDKQTAVTGVEPVRYIEITPQMRESVQKGQPLFTAAPAGAGIGAATMQEQENE
jgi:hypothetical protein